MRSTVILTEERLTEFVDYCLQQDSVFFDIETTGENRGIPHLNTACWLGLATHGAAVSIPHGHPIGSKQIGEHKEPRRDKYGEWQKAPSGKVKMFRTPDYEPPPPQLTTDQVYGIIRPLFESEKVSKVAHDASFDLASTAKYLGGLAKRPFECNIVLDWVLNENRHAYGLKMRTKQEYKVDYDQENTGREVEKHPFDNVAHYVYMDVKYGWMLYQKHRPLIEAQGLEDIYALELDILEIMATMRLTGVNVDVPRLEELREELGVRVEQAKGQVWLASGRPRWNLNSTPQKQDLLWGPKSKGGQGLRPWKLTDSARGRKKAGQKDFGPRDYSTDAESLESFPGNPLCSALLGYQEINKLLTTYVDGWLGVEGDPGNKIAEKLSLIFDERIYANFVQYAAGTGRFGCRDPNLQNIPRSGTELGTILRNVFCAPSGWKLITADYSQIEPRVMAHYIGRGMLYDGFLAGVDPYIVNASAALGKDGEDITKDERQKFGKTLFLAMGYGAQAKKLASSMGVSERRAEQILERHEDNMPEVYAYKDAVVVHARKQKPPHITTLLGRKRRLPDLLYAEWGLRMRAERQAFNALIQGSAADLMKLAMVRTFAGLREIPEAQMNLTVHDELVLSAPAKHAERVAEILHDGMTGPGIQKLIKVPLKADVQIGDRWGDLK